MHISPNRYHPCLWGLIKKQSSVHSVFYFTLSFSQGTTPKLAATYKKDKITYIEIKLGKTCDYSFDIGLQRLFNPLLKKYRPDLIHVHLFSGVNVIPILNAASSLGVKKILILHDHSLLCLKGVLHDGTKKCSIKALSDCNCGEVKKLAGERGMALSAYNQLRKEMIISIINMSDKVICCSYAQKRVLEGICGKSQKFVMLYYGIALPAIDKIIKKKDTYPVFGYLGSLHFLKGISVIEDALKRLRNHKYEILMGLRCNLDNPAEKRYLEKIVKYNVIKVLQNIRNREIYRDFFSRIDYLIIPSLWEETGPMTLFESFFCKVPVIISNQASMKEKIRGNKGSRVFKNAKELSDIMRKVIKGYICKTSRDVFKFKDIDKYTQEIELLYRDVIDRPSKTLKLKIGYLCNSRCIFCVTGDNHPKKFIDLPTLKGTLQKYRNTYEQVIITGGEPSFRKDFFLLIEFAYRLGYKITLETNARMFSNKNLCRQLEYFNLNIVTHIESFKPRTHDLTTMVLGSFNETIRGIKNIRKYCTSITIKIMLTRLNYKHLLYTVKFISNMDIDTVHFVFLTPWGSSYSYFEAIMPHYYEVRHFLTDALIWLAANSKLPVIIEGFPFCVVEPKFRDFLFEKPVKDKSRMFGIYPGKSAVHTYHIYKERLKQKKKFSQCGRCVFDKICEGVYKRYAEKRGSGEFIPIVKKLKIAQ